jgi:hypothetical protein
VARQQKEKQDRHVVRSTPSCYKNDVDLS